MTDYCVISASALCRGATKNALFGEAINGLRATLGLPPLDDVRSYVFGDPVLLTCDPVLGPWQPSELIEAVQTGAAILPDERPLPEGLEAFLRDGPPPVYVGFGSIAVAKEAARAAIEAIRAHGRRVVIAQGWAELVPIDDWDDCFAAGEVNQQALFARVAVAMHHGGAGTTVAAARAGALLALSEQRQYAIPGVLPQARGAPYVYSGKGSFPSPALRPLTTFRHIRAQGCAPVGSAS